MRLRRNCVRRARAARAVVRARPFACARSFACALLAAAALVALVAAGAAARQQGWTNSRRGAAGKDLNTLYFTDAKRGWIGGDGGQVLRTDDGGRSWLGQQLGVEAGVSDIYFRDKEDGYLLAGGAIYTTADGGLSWREARAFTAGDFGGATPELYSVRFTGKRRGWVVGSVSSGDNVLDSLLLRTDDGGQTWQRRVVPARVELFHLDFDGDKRGWIVGDRGTILHTADGGETWAAQKSGTSAALYHVEFADKEDGWAVGERATVLRTTDGGETWLTVEVPALASRLTLLSVAFAGDEQGWIVGRAGTILRSSDGGRTWVRQDSGTSKHIYALVVGKKQAWAVGGDGMVLEYER